MPKSPNFAGPVHHGTHAFLAGICKYCKCRESWPLAKQACPNAKVKFNAQQSHVRALKRKARLKAEAEKTNREKTPPSPVTEVKEGSSDSDPEARPC